MGFDSRFEEANLWLEFVNNHHCGLCGNSGTIDTRGHVMTPAGIRVGVRRYCICPNGRALRSICGNAQLTENDS